MSLRWRDRRAELFERAAGRELRRDWSAARKPARRRMAWMPLVVVAAIALLSVAALRVSILRLGYALPETLQHATVLRSRERSAAVAAREQRDPHKLRELAAQQGFTRPDRVIDLSDRASAR
jgi:hypothetical protein